MAIDYKEAKRLLLKKLGMKSYATLELKGWLKEKGVESAISEQLLEEFQQLGYLNDTAWLASFVRVQRARRYGSRTIALKLMQKGFSKEQIAAALASDDPADEGAAIQKLLESRYRSRDLKNPRERQKVVASLMRRGFSLDLIFKTLKFVN